MNLLKQLNTKYGIHKRLPVGIFIIFFSFFFFRSIAQQTKKLVAECTITYSIKISDNEKNEQTIKKLYIKGRKTRSEISLSSFYQATIFDNKTGEAVILKEIGGDKYISTFNAQQWKNRNKRWNNVSVKETNEMKNILNFPCRKVITTLQDGSSFAVYYTINLTASATENPFQFKNIPGLILEYESLGDNDKNIEFKAVDMNFSPVPAAKFTIPSSGYRIL